ncbi:MAG: GNAT family N-acetyltransferase, partial [Candidatus Eisenbacteria bacterium]|nr:GNAT family N-acetyltransferase [Candidatus Eisenbacteria bacterium]
VTGGRLRWGLSAAGYLDPDVFRFFQSHGVDLVSGFGMTEATGGITMTPPGRYRTWSVGLPLPGIEVKLAEDGELLIRGPYVARAFGPGGPASGDPETEWLATGDLAREDEDGFLAIIGRKKDLFKNIKGETIAPQLLENHLRAFAEVEQAVVVGDARPYNVALLYVKGAGPPGDPDLRHHVANLVTSVNRFLAPYERIVDFALLSRPLEVDRGELTAKGTPRRETVEEHFDHLLRELYRRSDWRGVVDEIQVRVPEWVFRYTGWTLGDLEAAPSCLRWRGRDTALTVKYLDEEQGLLQLGSLIYRVAPGPLRRLELDDFLRHPVQWLGNVELVSFLDETLLRLPRRRSTARAWPAVVRAIHPGPARWRTWRDEPPAQAWGMERFHRSMAAAQWAAPAQAVAAARRLSRHLTAPVPDRARLARHLMRRLLEDRRVAVASEAFVALLPRETGADLERTLAAFVDRHPRSHSTDLFQRLLQQPLSPAQLRALSRMACAEVRHRPAEPTRGRWLLSFFSFWGERHPQDHPYIREALAAWFLLGPDAMRREAGLLLSDLRERYRAQLEETVPRVQPRHVVIDPALGLELRARVERLLTQTACVADAVEVLSGGALTARRLDEATVRAERLSRQPQETAVRVAVSLPGGQPFEFLLRPETDRSPEEVQREIWWHLLLGISGPRGPLTPEVGRYWQEFRIWSSQLSPFPPLDSLLRELERGRLRTTPRGRTGTWTHLAWSALTSFCEFWNRTGRRMMMSDPAPARVAAPLHDYQEGVRLLSVGPLEPFRSLRALLETLWERFVQRTEASYPALQGVVGWEILFAAFVEAVGPGEGLPLLAGLMELESESPPAAWRDALEDFLHRTEAEGFRPRRLAMAVARYHRWLEHNPDVHWMAQARTLSEIQETYNLDELAEAYPETRLRIFMETVFAFARPPLMEELRIMLQRSRAGRVGFEDLLAWITHLHQKLTLNEEEVYFLARLAYGSLAPSQEATWLVLDRGTGPKVELVVARRDALGDEFWIRPPAQPAEIAQLHRLFQEEGLNVTFLPEHDYLLLVNEQQNVLGGLYYREFSPQALHMEKIVVTRQRRGRGLGAALMDEFCRQAGDRGYRAVTTGFFRHQYFARLGFETATEFPGLVRHLDAARA